jgi:hypothetical protein
VAEVQCLKGFADGGPAVADQRGSLGVVSQVHSAWCLCPPGRWLDGHEYDSVRQMCDSLRRGFTADSPVFARFGPTLAKDTIQSVTCLP